MNVLLLTWPTLVIRARRDKGMCTCVADILFSSIERGSDTRCLALQELFHVRARRVDLGVLCISFIDEGF